MDSFFIQIVIRLKLKNNPLATIYSFNGSCKIFEHILITQKFFVILRCDNWF